MAIIQLIKESPLLSLAGVEGGKPLLREMGVHEFIRMIQSNDLESGVDSYDYMV